MAETLLEDVRQIAQDELCLKGAINIAIYDAAYSEKYRLGSSVSANDFPVQILWPFENLPAGLPPEYLTRKDYLTRPHSPNHVLSHELGHLIFTAYVMKGQVDAGGYGSAAPDWLDEAVAIMFDHPAQRALRQSVFRQTVQDQSIPTLETLAALERSLPEFHLAMPQVGNGDLTNEASLRHVATGTITHEVEPKISLPNYYGQIESVLLFLDDVISDEGGRSGCLLVNGYFTPSHLGLKIARYNVTNARAPTVSDESLYFSWLARWANVELTEAD